MFDVNKIRNDFPMLRNHTNLAYLDNGATTFKPDCVVNAVRDFYSLQTSNIHRGDYALSQQADALYDEVRSKVAKFIHCDEKEVVFTSGCTAALNQIAYGLAHNFLKAGDVILTTEAEHASNLLPWFRLEKEFGIRVEYIPLDKEAVCHIDAFKQVIHPGVKAVAIAAVSNVLGATQPIKEMTKICHDNGILMIVDGAQSVPHQKTDVKDTDVDFLAFSGHKMCGPSGVGVLYGKYELLEKMDPMLVGGGMNARFNACGITSLKQAPLKFEAGTQNIEGVIGLGAAIDYLMSIGIDEIHAYEQEIRRYFIERISKLDHIEVYNVNNTSGPIAFNAKGVFAQDAAAVLGHHNVAVRSGNHCAKILHEIIGTTQTVRASLYFYTTREEIDRAIEAMKEITVENAIGIFF